MGKIKVLWKRLKDQQKSGFDYIIELSIFFYPVISLILHTQIDPSTIHTLVYSPGPDSFMQFMSNFKLDAQVYTDLTISMILMFMRLGILLLAYSQPAPSKIFGGIMIVLSLIFISWTSFQTVLVGRFLAEQVSFRFIIYALVIHIGTDVVKSFVLRDPV